MHFSPLRYQFPTNEWDDQIPIEGKLDGKSGKTRRQVAGFSLLKSATNFPTRARGNSHTTTGRAATAACSWLDRKQSEWIPMPNVCDHRTSCALCPPIASLELWFLRSAIGSVEIVRWMTPNELRMCSPGRHNEPTPSPCLLISST